MGACGKMGSKVSTCLYIDKRVLDTAKRVGLNVSRVSENALIEACMHAHADRVFSEEVDERGFKKWRPPSFLGSTYRNYVRETHVSKKRGGFAYMRIFGIRLAPVPEAIKPEQKT
jgi:post-segregation antitoxin (ccd killing protein)